MTSRSARIVVFAVLAVVQLAVAGGAIITSELALRTGDVFRFRVQPVDPVDAFRGRYVAIRFAVDRAPAPDGLDLKPRQWVFVPLLVDGEGMAAFGPAALEPPEDGAYLRLRSQVIAPDEEGNRQVWLTLPFARYYMDEHVAPEAEWAVWSGPRGRRDASVTVRVRNGVGVLEKLYIDGVPIDRWLSENAPERQ